MTKKRNKQGYTTAIKKAFENYRWWDFGYMLRFEKAIWKDWLDKYTKKEFTHALDEYSDRRAAIAKLALKLLEIYEYTVKANVYVNTRNAKRFININFFNHSFDPSNTYHISELRSEKAWHLYNLLRDYKLQEMWD